MSWLVPFYIGILYFCFGLAILSADVFNNGLDYTATNTVTVSTLIFQPIPTDFVVGYLPYKPSISTSPWLDTIIEEDSGRKENKKQGTDTRYEKKYANVDDLPGCQPGMKSCRGLGHSVCFCLAPIYLLINRPLDFVSLLGRSLINSFI